MYHSDCVRLCLCSAVLALILICKRVPFICFHLIDCIHNSMAVCLHPTSAEKDAISAARPLSHIVYAVNSVEHTKPGWHSCVRVLFTLQFSIKTISITTEFRYAAWLYSKQRIVSCVMNNISTIHDTEITPIHSMLGAYLSRVLNSLRYNKNRVGNSFDVEKNLQ